MICFKSVVREKHKSDHTATQKEKEPETWTIRTTETALHIAEAILRGQNGTS
jgi:hypothetical protein